MPQQAFLTPFGIRSPDVVVDCANPRGQELAAANPILIAEVPSPSTANRGFTEKLEQYGAIASLQTYLICAQDEPRTWVWARQVDGAWPGEPFVMTGREGSIALGGLGIEQAMAGVIRSIPEAPTVE
jgi:Uma2 family endonuclease